jgi:hypothetical protein
MDFEKRDIAFSRHSPEEKSYVTFEFSRPKFCMHFFYPRFFISNDDHENTLSFRMLSRHLEIKMHKNIIIYVLMYETGYFNLHQEVAEGNIYA